MKTVHIASILVVSALTVFACGDDDDDRPRGTAGSAGQGGSPGGEGGSAAGQAGSSAAGQAPVGGGAGESGGSAGEVSGGDAGAAVAGAGGAIEPPACVNDVVFTGAGDGGAGGEGGAGGAASQELEPGILGTWVDNFGGGLEITASHWNSGTIQAWDNTTNVVYTQNSSCSAFSPRKFSKYVYTQPVNDSFYFCTIVYDADTLAAAQASTKMADASDLDGVGCNGFSWSKATKQ